MNATQILQLISSASGIFGVAVSAYAAIKGDLDAQTQAQVEAALAKGQADLDSARKELDADAA